MSTGQPDDRRLGVTGLLAAGRFDALLAVLLAVLAVSLGSFREAGWVIALDVVAAALAALVARWPTVAGVGLGLLLLGYLFVPDDAPTLGEYAPLIAILGAGMRGQRRLRAWMCAGFGVVLALLTYRDYPGSPLFLFGTLVWAVLFAVLWLIGDLFTAHRRMQADAAAFTVLHERLALARELHDTTARTLARVLFVGDRLTSSGEGDPAVDQLLIGVRQASDELRRSLITLRNAEPLAGPDRSDPLVVAAGEAQAGLESAGFPTMVSIDGDLAHVPASVKGPLAAALGEAAANVERYGLRGQPCAISLWVDSGGLGLVVSNEVARQDDAIADNRVGLGLLGVAERVSAIGGDMDVEREGSTWWMRITVPLA